MRLKYKYEVKLESKDKQDLILFIDTVKDDLEKIVEEKLINLKYEAYQYKIKNIKLINKDLKAIIKNHDLEEINIIFLAVNNKVNASKADIKKTILKIKQGYSKELALMFLNLKLDEIKWFKLNPYFDFDNKLKNKIGFMHRITSVRYTGEFEGQIIGTKYNEQIFDLNEILYLTKAEIKLLEEKLGKKIKPTEILTENKAILIKKYMKELNKYYLDDFSDIDKYIN